MPRTHLEARTWTHRKAKGPRIDLMAMTTQRCSLSTAPLPAGPEAVPLQHGGVQVTGTTAPPQSRLSEEEGLVHGCADSAKDRAWDVASTQAALLVERTNKYKAVGSYPPTNKSETVDIHTLFLSLLLFSTTFWATVNTKPGFVGWVPLPLWGFSYSVNIFFKGHFLSTFSCLYPSDATLANLFSDLTVSGFNTSIW